MAETSQLAVHLASLLSDPSSGRTSVPSHSLEAGYDERGGGRQGQEQDSGDVDKTVPVPPPFGPASVTL